MWFLLSVLLILSVHVSVDAQSPVIDTQLGRIQGFDYRTTNGAMAEIYLNIPYAKPPVGPLRFEKPVGIDPWSNIRNGTAFGYECIPHVQAAILLGKEASEDCLTLNIFRPKQPSTSGPLPVLVWVHGGGFEIGSTSIFGYKGFADAYIPQDIIVVTIQYRLGVLGFFSTGNSDVPGNLGLWDMALAFKFINTHISSFGGDPSRVTAWGLSAGGCAVGQLALSPISRDYVSGTIEMSGSPFAAWGYGADVPQHSIQLAQTLGCSVHGSIRNCMKRQSIDQIFEAVLKIGYTTNDLRNIKWGPVVDGEFMPDYADKLLEDPSLPHKPSIVGVSNKDAAYFMLMGYSPYIHNASVGKENIPTFYQEQLRERLRNFITPDLYGQNTQLAIQNIENYYVNQAIGQQTNGYYLDKYNQFGTDLLFNLPASQEIKAKRRAGWPVFAYSFDHYNEKIWEGKDIPKEARGSVHVNEYSYMFDLFIMGKFNITGDELIVKDTMQRTIISFTKYGAPEMSGGQYKYVGNTSQLQYLSISPQPSMQTGFNDEAVSFWNSMCTLGFDLVTMTRTDGTNCDIDSQF